MVLDDLAAQVETYACSLVGGLGGEERVEYLVDDRRLDADAVVAYLQDVSSLGLGGEEKDLGGRLLILDSIRRAVLQILLGLFHHGIDGIAEQVHDGLVEHVGITVYGHTFRRQGKYGLYIVLFYLLGIVSVENLLVLLQHGQQVHIYKAAGTVFQHLLHSLEHAAGVLAVLVHVREILCQHAECILGI